MTDFADDDSWLRDLARAGPPAIDLTDGGHLAFLTDAADRLLARYPDRGALDRLTLHLAEPAAEVFVALALAAKLATSKRIVETLGAPLHVSVVFAVYGEHQRILPRSEHPHGEDFLVRKVEQLRWLFGARPDLTWDLMVVDDGCPHGSGKIAERLVAAHGLEGQVRVLFLADAITAGIPVTAPLGSPAESRKGGSILYGLWAAAHAEHARHVIVYTDADLSTHLGQAGLLLEPICDDGKAAAIASRREPTSVVVKQGVRNRRGKLFIYLWKRLLPVLGSILDTQCGFKAFRADMVREIVEQVEEKGFAFDIELLVQVLQRHPDSVAIVPIGWIDSEAASTTTDLQPYLTMLRAVARMYRTHLPPSAAADSFAELILSLDEASWNRLVERVPDEIAAREPSDLGAFDGVSARALVDAIDQT